MSKDTNDEFGNRMKEYEQAEAGRKFLRFIPICVRLDGRSFSNYTRDLARPYDVRMSTIMVNLTKLLVEEFNACIGYTQSDEISMVLYSDKPETEIIFDGKIQKLVSVMASFASAHFNDAARRQLPGGTDRPLATFDCRCWQTPTLSEATNSILWREFDATKNSISMAAQHYFSHKELQGKKGNEMQDMLFKEKQVNWNDYPAFFKRGTYLQRRRVLKNLSEEDLALIPEKHRPIGQVERNEVIVLDMPPFTKVTNRIQVAFFGNDPIVETQKP